MACVFVAMCVYVCVCVCICVCICVCAVCMRYEGRSDSNAIYVDKGVLEGRCNVHMGLLGTGRGIVGEQSFVGALDKYSQ